MSIFALYCIILSTYSGNGLIAGGVSSGPAESEFCAPVVSSNLFCHTEQAESVTSVYSNSSRTTLKNSFNQFSACPLAVGKLLFYKYLPYVYYPVRNIVRFKSTDIIFPFHYFW